MERGLPNLPPSSDEYWEEADVELTNMLASTKHEHEFFMEGSREIKCNKCGMGLFIGEGDTLKEGHLYHEGKFII